MGVTAEVIFLAGECTCQSSPTAQAGRPLASLSFMVRSPVTSMARMKGFPRMEIKEPVTVTRSLGAMAKPLFCHVALGRQDRGHLPLRGLQQGMDAVIGPISGGGLLHPHHFAGDRSHGPGLNNVL